jgi:large subunit ribosomal protein L6
MSRIGKKIIEIPAGVTVSRADATITVQGPKGVLSLAMPQCVEVAIGEGTVGVKRPSDDRKARSEHGLMRTLIGNMVVGVSKGFEKGLEISGVGYRAEVNNDVLKMVLGYSNPVEYKIPAGISVRVDKQVNIFVSGIDKQLVGRVAAEIRSFRKPEPYKGKGIKYAGERIRRKVGKSVGA